MKALIILACEGRIDEDFRFCSGVNNVILDLETISHTENFKSLVVYLDKVPKLFDGACCVNNIITNAVHKIYELNYLTEVKYKYICNFYQFHARCGMILKVEPK